MRDPRRALARAGAATAATVALAALVLGQPATSYADATLPAPTGAPAAR